jgi:hypothetical protein
VKGRGYERAESAVEFAQRFPYRQHNSRCDVPPTPAPVILLAGRAPDLAAWKERRRNRQTDHDLGMSGSRRQNKRRLRVVERVDFILRSDDEVFVVGQGRHRQSDDVTDTC